MSAMERVVVVLTLMQRLREVMTAETEAVRRMQLDRLTTIQEEKRLLGDSYERELRQLRAEPELLATLPQETRVMLQEAMREMQTAVRRNIDMLGAAKIVVERLLRRVAEGMQALPMAANPPAGGARVIAVAFDRQV